MRLSRCLLARRRHAVMTPYDFVDMALPTVPSVDMLLRGAQDEAQITCSSAEWSMLSDDEVRRLLLIMPRVADECKERYIQYRRLSSYFEMRRAAGHRARVRLSQRLDKYGDTGLRQHAMSHFVPVEP